MSGIMYSTYMKVHDQLSDESALTSEQDKLITMRGGMKDFFFLFSVLDKALWHGACGTVRPIFA